MLSSVGLVIPAAHTWIAQCLQGISQVALLFCIFTFEGNNVACAEECTLSTRHTHASSDFSTTRLTRPDSKASIDT